MKAVQIANPPEMKVVDLEKPAVGAGEVLVRIKYVGFCGSDLNTFLGRNPMVKLPVIPGHEVGAVIEEIGPNVPAGFEKGMNVTLNPYTNCGKCASCRNGRVNACEHNETLGVQRNGVMCEYAVLPWTKIIPAGNISPRDCALIEPMSVGFHAVSRAQVIDNEYVMVIGCGMIGIGVKKSTIVFLFSSTNFSNSSSFGAWIVNIICGLAYTSFAYLNEAFVYISCISTIIMLRINFSVES